MLTVDALAAAVRPFMVASGPRTLVHFARCESAGCARETSYGKPRCEEHILDLDYAGAVRALVDQREDEARRLMGHGARGGELLLADLVHLLVTNGPVTRKRIAQRLALHPRVVDALVASLCKAGHAANRTTPGGRTVVAIVLPVAESA